MDKMTCEAHGTAAATYVCQHIANGLLRRERVGFFWSGGDPESLHPDAWCYECNERVKKTEGEWKGEALENAQPQVMCSHCYEIARTFHMGGDPWS